VSACWSVGGLYSLDFPLFSKECASNFLTPFFGPRNPCLGQVLYSNSPKLKELNDSGPEPRVERCAKKFENGI
jgi:hypothetical protein